MDSRNTIECFVSWLRAVGVRFLTFLLSLSLSYSPTLASASVTQSTTRCTEDSNECAGAAIPQKLSV